MGEFYRKIRTARNVAYRYLQPGGDSEPRAGDDWERLRAAAVLWLAPEIPAAFDAREFAPLPAAQRAELAAAVAAYQNVCAGRPPTDDQMSAGLKELGRVVAALGETLTDPEGLSLLAVLLRESGPLPPFILGFDYNLDTDWSGAPGVWIWVIVPDELDPDCEEFAQFTARFPRIVGSAFIRAGNDRFPYIHYRLLSEAIGVVGGAVV